MAVRIRCPSCDTMNRMDEDERGRRVRCRECNARFRVPSDDDDDDDDLPRGRRRAPSRPAGSWLPIIAGLLGGGALVLFLCVGSAALGFVLLFRAGDRVNRARERANNDRNVVAVGKMVFDQHGVLALNDPFDPTPELAEVGARMKVHQVRMEAGKSYVISLNSDAFDAYLRVESPTGKVLAEDDDGGDLLNARLVFRPTETAVFRVIATSWDGRTGPFHLFVQEAN